MRNLQKKFKLILSVSTKPNLFALSQIVYSKLMISTAADPGGGPDGLVLPKT